MRKITWWDKLRVFKIDSFGFWFPYHDDVVGYLWPWRWKFNNVFWSVMACASFSSLRELKEFWKEFDICLGELKGCYEKITTKNSDGNYDSGIYACGG